MFASRCEIRGPVTLPQFSGTRIMMMPVVLGDIATAPLPGWSDAMNKLFAMCPQHHGCVGYLTIDEKVVPAGKTHRRAGLHVDGIYRNGAGGWGGSWGGGWGAAGTGMLTVSSHYGCRAWDQCFDGWPGPEGECGHLASQCGEATRFPPGVVYWVDGLCVHESVAMSEPTKRQFVRLSMPSTAPWFEGYTESPVGVRPTGPILPRRPFMDA